jgi:hypothetical protein
MIAMRHLDRLLARYGEQHRRLLEDALKFYDERQLSNPTAWGTVNVDGYIASVMERATRRKEEN